MTLSPSPPPHSRRRSEPIEDAPLKKPHTHSYTAAAQTWRAPLGPGLQLKLLTCVQSPPPGAARITTLWIQTGHAAKNRGREPSESMAKQICDVDRVTWGHGKRDKGHGKRDTYPCRKKWA